VHTAVDNQPCRIIPLHRGFVLRDYHLQLEFASGARFDGIVFGVSHDVAEEIACKAIGEKSYNIVRSDSRPMPLQCSFSDTLPTLDPSSALADMAAAAALRRSEAMPEDLPTDPGPGPSGADFDAYNAAHRVHGQASSTTAGRLAPLRRSHTSSSMTDDMRLPLYRNDLWIAAAAVALAVASVLLLRG